MNTRNLQFPDEHLKAIAHVAIRSSHLEHYIETLADVLMLDTPETSKFLLKQLHANRVVQYIDCLLRDKFPQERSQIKEMVEAIEKARKARNEIMHYVWGAAPKESEFVELMSMRPHREPDLKQKTADDIYGVADDLLLASRKTLKIMALLRSSFRKHEPQSPPLGSPEPTAADQRALGEAPLPPQQPAPKSDLE